MIRHKTLLTALTLLWGALQLLVWVLMLVLMEHTHQKVFDALFIFGSASAVITVWCYDLALKPPHMKDRRSHARHEIKH